MNVHYALPNADLCAYPSVAETVKLWDAGLEEAREAAIALGMNAASKKGGIIPDASWNAPWFGETVDAQAMEPDEDED